ncbi:MAG: heme exporter protein CcmD [Pseudomonadales bacterium]|nr:heme exporter protein CcmD [Pseudomonadales bacterium]
MSFESFADFLAMGKHGPYVWSCYALTLIVLVLNVVRPIQVQKQFIRQKQRAMEIEAGADKPQEPIAE